MPARSRFAASIAGALIALALVAGCTGERPSLGDAPTTTVPRLSQLIPKDGVTSTTAATTSVVASTAAPAALNPTTLQGFIATPSGTPVVHTAPSDTSPPISVGAKTEAGAPTTFAIVGDPTTVTDGWYQVVLPTRPNGGVGWVPANSVTVSKTPFRVFVDLTKRTLRVERDGVQVFEAPVAIGTTTNPTPTGASYVTELIDNANPKGSYGPYAFGLALHSDTLTEFAGGPGQVGIHGTNQPQLIGQAVSHGCVRLKNADVEAMVNLQLPLGVPVFIS